MKKVSILLQAERYFGIEQLFKFHLSAHNVKQGYQILHIIIIGILNVFKNSS